ncbi:MAG: sulfotransferase domain-containing protein [Magnetococcales bacterium]|nr:sulfotransferase domain-containing protein [Magnetococcales bacterium]
MMTMTERPSTASMPPPPSADGIHTTEGVDALVWAAVAERSSGDHRAKMAKYQQALAHASELGDVARHLLLGLVNLDTGKPDKALPHLEQAAALNPGEALNDLFLGQAQTQLGRYDLALQNFQRCQQLDPQCTGVHHSIGMVHALLGDHDTSIHYHRRELQKNELLMESAFQMVEARQMQFAHRHGRRAESFAELANQLYLDRLARGLFAERDSEGDPSLVSLAYDKCGTHLIADVLQALTGQRSNWAYHEDPNPLNRFPEPVPSGEFVAGNWYPHDHFVSRILGDRSRVVLQYRDPRDAAVSGYFYCHKPEVLVSDSVFAKAVRGAEKGPGILYILEQWSNAILHWAVLWMEARVPLYISTFEDIVNHKAQSTARIARYLGVVDDEAAIQRVVAQTAFKKRSASLVTENLSENFKRKGQSGDWRNHFTPEMIDYARFKVGRSLVSLGYEQDPNWS